MAEDVEVGGLAPVPHQGSIRAYVVEDEEPARNSMVRLLESDPEIELVGAAWGRAAADAIIRSCPDLLLLDVRMPGMDGFELLEHVAPEVCPVVIFVTAYDEYAVEAFDVRAIDYLLKPFTEERFGEAITRAKARLRSGRRSLPDLSSRHPGRSAVSTDEASTLASLRKDRLVLRDGGRLLSIPHGDITWIEASGVYVLIHTSRGREHMVRCAMKDLDDLLASSGFFRIHRSAIVNLVHVREVEPTGHGDGLVRLVEGTKVRLSRSRRDEFEEVFLGDQI